MHHLVVILKQFCIGHQHLTKFLQKHKYMQLIHTTQDLFPQSLHYLHTALLHYIQLYYITYSFITLLTALLHYTQLYRE